MACNLLSSPLLSSPLLSSPLLVASLIAASLSILACDSSFDGDAVEREELLEALSGRESDSVVDDDAVGDEPIDQLAPVGMTPFPDDPAELLPAPVVAMVEFEGGESVEFVAIDADTVGIGFGGPIDSAVVDTFPMIFASAASPLDAYLVIAGVDEAPDALVTLSESVVNAGNWSGCSNGSQTDGVSWPERLAAAEAASAERSGSGADALVAEPRTTSATCDHLVAWGQTLPANAGNCTVFHRDYEETTDWTFDDLTAFAGHVIAVSGTHDWYVEHRNCNTGSCDYSTDWTKWNIQAGYHYFFWMADNNDDFRAQSHVQSNGNGGQHNHDVARIHDWYHRVVWTSFGNQAHGIEYNWTSLYCTETDYEGADPSNIATGMSWDGFNGEDC